MKKEDKEKQQIIEYLDELKKRIKKNYVPNSFRSIEKLDIIDSYACDMVKHLITPYKKITCIVELYEKK